MNEEDIHAALQRAAQQIALQERQALDNMRFAQRPGFVPCGYPQTGVKAEERARELLYEHLTPAQQDDLQRKGYFWVTGNVTKTRYRIYPWCGRPNIALDGKHLICVGPSYGLPIPPSDRVLAQKVTIELAEDRMLEALNLTPERLNDLRRHFQLLGA